MENTCTNLENTSAYFTLISQILSGFTIDESTEIFNQNLWMGKPNDWQPKAMITKHAVAVSTNLQENNEG